MDGKVSIMIIKYDNSNYSFVEYTRAIYSREMYYLVSKDGYIPKKISNGMGENVEYKRNWKMSFLHELGHIYLMHRFNKYQECIFPMTTFRDEIMSWRIAKSIMKPKLWTEEHAIRLLKEYAIYYNINVNWDKFKLIELNKGLKIK